MSRPHAASVDLTQKILDDRNKALAARGDTTKFDPYATLSQSHLSFGCLFQDTTDRSSYKIVLTISPENNILISKNGVVHESIPGKSVRDIVASSRPDVQVLTTDSTSSCKCYTFVLTVDPLITSDGESVRNFLCGSLYDVQMLTKYITMMMSGKNIATLPVPQYDKAGFVEIGRDGLWARKWCVLAGERLLFYNEKRSEIPYQCITLPSISQFDLTGYNYTYELPPVPAHLAHLPPEYPYMATVNSGIDIEILQWPGEEDADNWFEDIMERREEVVDEYEAELENIRRMKEEQEEAAYQQTQVKEKFLSDIKPFPVHDFTTHTRPHCSLVNYGFEEPGQVAFCEGNSFVGHDVSDALMSQSLQLISFPALARKQMIEVGVGGSELEAFVDHEPNVHSSYFAVQDIPSTLREVRQPTGHCVAITAQGKAYVWGSGPNGVLGLGPDKVEQNVPVIMTPLIKETIVQVSCGYTHTLLLTVDGDVLTFGTNQYGQLALSPTDAMSGYPRKVELPDPVRHIYASGNSSFVLTVKGHCYCWGSNVHNILGLAEDVLYYDEPTFHPELSGSLQQISISPDGTHALAVMYHVNGAPNRTSEYAATVYSWGLNTKGQLGMGTSANVSHLPTPTPIPKLTNIPLVLSERGELVTVEDHPNIIGVCATNGASAVWYSTREVMIWGRAGVTGFGNDSQSPHKMRANNLNVINIVSASSGFLFVDVNNALFASNSTQGIYPITTQSAGNNAAQTLYGSIVAAFPGPMRTISSDSQPRVGSAIFVVVAGEDVPDEPPAPLSNQLDVPVPLSNNLPTSTARTQRPSNTPASVHTTNLSSYQGPGAGKQLGSTNVYMTGRTMDGPMMPRRGPPPPPSELDAPAPSKALHAQSQVEQLIHGANQSGLLDNAQNAESIQRDVLAAASLILNLHMESSNRQQQQQQQQQQAAAGMDFMSMVGGMQVPSQPLPPDPAQQQPQRPQGFVRPVQPAQQPEVFPDQANPMVHEQPPLPQTAQYQQQQPSHPAVPVQPIVAEQNVQTSQQLGGVVPSTNPSLSNMITEHGGISAQSVQLGADDLPPPPAQRKFNNKFLERKRGTGGTGGVPPPPSSDLELPPPPPFDLELPPPPPPE